MYLVSVIIGGPSHSFGASSIGVFLEECLICSFTIDSIHNYSLFTEPPKLIFIFACMLIVQESGVANMGHMLMY